MNLVVKHKIFIIAIVFTFVRFYMWDYQYIFNLLLPKHDGLHGVTAFATSMHSIRMGDGIAWWNPGETSGGWAQYYSGFLSPLPPTYGSIGFVLCAFVVKVFNIFGVIVPEYYLYVIINNIVYPFLSCFFLLKLFNLFWKNIYADILIGGVFLLRDRFTN